MIDMGQWTQFDLEDPDDCIELVRQLGFTNAQIKDMKARKIRYHSAHNKMLKGD